MNAKEFFESSKVQILIPQNTVIDIQKVFENYDERTWADDGFSIDERTLLYFGGYFASTNKICSLTHS